MSLSLSLSFFLFFLCLSQSLPILHLFAGAGAVSVVHEGTLLPSKYDDIEDEDTGGGCRGGSSDSKVMAGSVGGGGCGVLGKPVSFVSACCTARMTR